MIKFKIQVGDYVATEGMDELERREVASMLMKAGALEGEGSYHANIHWDYIGVNRGGVFYFDAFASFAEDCGRTRKITIDQLRDAAGESEEKPSAWDGEGLPPVGTVCEATWGFNGSWMKAVALEHRNDFLSFACKIDLDWRVFDSFMYGDVIFRPIQSEEQRQVAEIARIVEGLAGSFDYAEQIPQGVAKAIYNAGFRKEMSDGR